MSCASAIGKTAFHCHAWGLAPANKAALNATTCIVDKMHGEQQQEEMLAMAAALVAFSMRKWI